MILSRNTEGDTNWRNAEKWIRWIIRCRTDTLWEKGNRKVARLKKTWAEYTGRRVRTGIVVFSNKLFEALLSVLHCVQSVIQSLGVGRHQGPPGDPKGLPSPPGRWQGVGGPSWWHILESPPQTLPTGYLHARMNWKGSRQKQDKWQRAGGNDFKGKIKWAKICIAWLRNHCRSGDREYSN